MINGTKINGQKYIYTALWADHYAASIWGIDHDYNIYGVDNTTYGMPQYNKNKVEFNASGSNSGVTFGAALGYNAEDSEGIEAYASGTTDEDINNGKAEAITVYPKGEYYAYKDNAKKVLLDSNNVPLTTDDVELQPIEIKDAKGEVTGYRTQINDKDGKMLCYSGQRVLPSNDFDKKYVRHDPSPGKGCIHRDYIEGGWALIKKNIEGKGASYYSECLEEGCTVPVFFAGDRMVSELVSTDAKVMVNKELKTVADMQADTAYTIGGLSVTPTRMYASVGKGDGSTSIQGPYEDTSYIVNGTADADRNYGGDGKTVGNYKYVPYGQSNMPNAMDKIYNAILNRDLRGMIGDTDVVYATDSKDDTKSFNSLDALNFTGIAPIELNDRYPYGVPREYPEGSGSYLRGDEWWLDHIDNSGYTGVRDRRKSPNLVRQK